MKDLVIMKDQQAVTTSMQVAEGFEKRHADVIRAIEDKIHSTENCVQYQNMFVEGTYQDRSGKTNKMYYMNRDGFSFIAFGFTGKKADTFKLKYIRAFNQMENHIKQQVQIDTTPRGLAKLALAASEETNERVDALEDDVLYLKEDAVLAVGDYNTVSDRVNKRVSEVAKAYGITSRKGRSALFKDINGGVKQITGVGRRTQLRKKHYEQVMEYINDWEPSTATRTIIRQMELDNEDIA